MTSAFLPNPSRGKRVTPPDPANTLAILVTYHPDHSVVENVRAASALVDRVLVVDNTPGPPPALLSPLYEVEGVEVQAMGRNVGIASALNRGLALSREQGFVWTLLLDQDTRLFSNFFPSAQRVVEESGVQVGIVGANFVSRWTRAPYAPAEGGLREVPFAVSSGTLLHTECVEQIGWLRDDFFIDYVDVEYCLRARKHGFSVVLAPEVVMEHGMAATTEHRVLGYARNTSNYSASRHYYMARNLVVTVRAHGRRERAWLFREAVQRLKLTALTLAMEPDRAKKLTAMLHGYVDGLRGRMGEAPGRYAPSGARGSGLDVSYPRPARGILPSHAREEGLTAGDGPEAGARVKTYVHIPYLDQRGAGMQRYVSGIVPALRRAGLDFVAVVGEAHGPQAWLERVPHVILLSERWTQWVPRPLIALARTAWIQFIFPVLAGRDATLLALAHEVAPFPLFRQVAVVHDLTDYKTFARRHSLWTRVRNEIWRAGIARSEAVITISEATRRDLEEALGIAGNHVAVIYEGVDRELFSPEPERKAPARPFLLYVGTLDPHKNIPFLLDVYGDLASRGLEVDLVLAGRYPEEQARALAKTVPLGLREGIRWVGFVPDAELAAMLVSCSAFVFPSRNEGFGLAAAEAMACGAPVVASSSGALAEVVGDGGVLLSPHDREGWAATLERLLADPVYRETLSARALDRAETFMWDRAAEAYLRILDRDRPSGADPEPGSASISL